MKKVLVLALALTATSGSLHAQNGHTARGNVNGEWRYWGGDAWSTRYSPLDQINASNFNSLRIAWQWKVDGVDEYYRVTPLYANGRLFTVGTNRRNTYAIDPATGKQIWTWGMDEGIRWQKAPRRFAGRGLAYWTDGTSERVITVLPGYHMVSLDAKTGKPDPMFGKNGVVDLMEGLGYPLVPLAVDDTAELLISDQLAYRQAKPGEKWDPVKKIGADGTVGIMGQIANSSPAVIVGDMIVVGNSHIHGYYPTHVANVHSWIRGYDIKTGKQVWKFNLIPQAGEYGADTWERGTKIGTAGVGKVDAWAPYSADPELGLVYIPVGMPIMDEYGGHRPGANLYGNSIVALDAKTGQRKWHYQMVHHDIWDYDTPMSPNLLDINIGGRMRKAVAQTTKQGWVYTFDRVTGEPIWPIVETPVLQSEIPSEKTWPTQPIPTKPVPYSQQGLQASDLIDYTPAIKDSALKLAQRCRMGPYYIPAADTAAKSGYKCAWYTPGASGGVNIDGGAAVDVETGMLYVGAQTGLGTIQVAKDPCSEFDYSSPHDACIRGGPIPPPPGYVPPGQPAPTAEQSFGRRGGPSQIGGVSILKVKELGGITAYDMNSGDKKWWQPNGGFLSPQRVDSNSIMAGINLPLRPSGGQAQIITTKSLVIYGTGRNGRVGNNQLNANLFATDKATGKQVGMVKIPAVTTAVPMTFMHQGKQYIVFAIGQNENTQLVALKLP